MDIFDSYSPRSGEIFLTENYIQVFETNKQPKHFSIDIIYVYILCSEVWHSLRGRPSVLRGA
jgi:hypothetical protein